MSDTRTTFSTIGAPAPDAVNDHPTLRLEHLTPERVVNADAGERLELHRLTLEAGATHLAAELERWTPTDLLETLESAHLVVLERAAVTSDFAARCNAELRRRADRLLAERRAARLALEPWSWRRCYAIADGYDARTRLTAPEKILRDRENIGATPAPLDTGREHGPCAERIRRALAPGDARMRREGWLLASSDGGRRSLVLWHAVPRESDRSDAWRQTLPRPAGARTNVLEWVGTHETRLGWQS